MTTPPELAPQEPRSSIVTSSAVRVIGLWILAGALFKLLQGTPAHLPQVVRDFPFPADLGVKYKAAIGIELAIFAFALLKPRWGWALVSLQLVVFVVVLAFTLDAPSCGCFGDEIVMPPWLMLVIDGLLLLLLVALQPWRRLGGRELSVVFPVLLAAVGVATPWFLDREVTDAGAVSGGGTPMLRPWVVFDVETWAGRDIGETEFAKVYPEDPYSLPPDGLWTFWRSTCDHCAEHLRHLKETDDGSRILTLIRIHEPNDTVANTVVHEWPDGPHVVRADLPDTMDYVVTTPAELEMEAYMVVRGAEGLGMDEEERRAAEAERAGQ